MIGIGLVLAAAGLIILLIGAGQAVQNHAFRDAKTVLGTVINKHRRSTKYGYAYLLKLSYTIDGISYEREVGVLKTEYESIEIGDQYKVQYRPNKPKRILRPEDTSPKMVKTLLIIGAALLVVGAALLFIIRHINK